MENKNYRDIFESFLKESADSFLMVPSRKVWHSIYNDMHPDRKWPSMAVCLLILSAVMFIGVSNNNSLSSAARNASPLSYADLSKNNNAVHTDINTRDHSYATVPIRAAIAAGIDFTSLNEVIPADADNNPGIIENEQPPLTASVTGIASNGISAAKNIYVPPSSAGAETEDSMSNEVTLSPVKNKVAQKEIKTENTDLSFITAAADKNITDILSTAAAKKPAPAKTQISNSKSAAETDRSWAEDYVLKHKPQMNKFKSRSAVTYFVTPSYGYRHLATAAGTQSAIGGVSINDRLKDTRALNLEAGAVVQYNIANNFRIKGGVQVNYNNYVSDVTALGHTLQTSFAPTPQADLSAVSGYEVKPGPDRLNRSTVQVSIPVGADLRIAGRNKFKWYLGATVQPSYTIGGSGYVVSQDAKYYIRDKSMLRKLNLNTAVETFVSYKPAPGITLSAGPQVRYQVMSSYKQAYKYSEKLYNVGVKIGLTTGF